MGLGGCQRVFLGPRFVARYSELLDVIHAIARRKRVPRAIAARLAESLRRLTSEEAAA